MVDPYFSLEKCNTHSIPAPFPILFLIFPSSPRNFLSKRLMEGTTSGHSCKICANATSCLRRGGREKSRIAKTSTRFRKKTSIPYQKEHGRLNQDYLTRKKQTFYLLCRRVGFGLYISQTFRSVSHRKTHPPGVTRFTKKPSLSWKVTWSKIPNS